VKVRFQFWRQSSAEWTAENPVLLRDEPGVEEDTGQWKFGDGVTAWNDLPYSSAGGSGTPGLSAYQVAVANGFVGTQSQWLASLQGADGADSTVPGPTGDSAYQVAVDNGFSGTEPEWLASLEGDDGLPGDDGPPGPPGEPLFNVLDHYGFVAAVGDPAYFPVVSDLSNGTVFINRLWVPPGKILTSLWAMVTSAGAHDGSTPGNKIALYDDSGVLIDTTAVDETIWSGAGWRGGPLADGPIAAQSAGRFVYMGIFAIGLTANPNLAYRVANDAFGFQFGPGGNKRRSILATFQSDLPASFNPASFGSTSSYTPLTAIS
jgi:hypothetical protein